MRICLAFLTLWIGFGYAQQPGTEPADGIYRIGPGITPPKLMKKVEPEYSTQARDALVQGTAVFEVVIDESGTPTNTTVLSPLGFGLDEQARDAIAKWRFTPAMKSGKPVKTRGVIEVNFRFLDTWYDQKAESRRTRFNLALRSLQQNDQKRIQQAVKAIEELSAASFPPAMFLMGLWLQDGVHFPRDEKQALLLIGKSAEKNYGPAMYEIGIRHMEGRGMPKDASKGLRLIQDASILGSTHAQFYLGVIYEAGEVVEKDIERARRSFRLCAAARQPVCQYRLAKSLLDDPSIPERNIVQAVAWLQLAAEQGNTQATGLLSQHSPRLTAGQQTWAAQLKAQLVRKPM